jgi:hypothetical protein
MVGDGVVEPIRRSSAIGAFLIDLVSVTERAPSVREIFDRLGLQPLHFEGTESRAQVRTIEANNP